MSAGSAALTNNNAATYCTGVTLLATGSSTCTGQYNGKPADAAGATGDYCYVRLALDKANEYLTAKLLSAKTVASYTAMVDDSAATKPMYDYY